MQPKFEETFSPTVSNPAARSINYAVPNSDYKSGEQVGNVPHSNYPQAPGAYPMVPPYPNYPPAPGAYPMGPPYPNYPPAPGAYPMVPPYQNPEITQIRDYLPWSISNMFVAWLLGGILPLIFSLLCRRYKRNNNAHRARTMSVLALIFNILVTLAGIAGWIGLIVALVTAKKAVNTYANCAISIYC